MEYKEWWKYVDVGHTLQCTTYGGDAIGHGWESDKIFTVTKVMDTPSHVITHAERMFVDESGCTIYAASCRPYFKEGDWVVGWQVSGSEYYNTAWKILEITGNNAYSPKKGYNSCREFIRFASKEEIKSSFLKTLIKGYYYHITEGGKFCIFRLDECTTDPDRVKATYVTDFNSSLEFALWIKDKKCRVATDEEIAWLRDSIAANTVVKKSKEATYKFKLGQLVRLIANTSWSCNKIGDIGIVDKVGPFRSNGNTEYRITVKGNANDGNWSFENELELYTIIAISGNIGTVCPTEKLYINEYFVKPVDINDIPLVTNEVVQEKQLVKNYFIKQIEL